MKYGRNETSRNAVGSSDPALDITHLDKETRMPVNGNITARGDSASGQSTNTWKSIGELARQLAEKQGGAV